MLGGGCAPCPGADTKKNLQVSGKKTHEQAYDTQTKILKVRTNRSECAFEKLFQRLVAKKRVLTLEKCVENAL
jgi:hypothetical protein